MSKMPFMIKNITELGRRKLCVVLMSLNIIQIFVALGWFAFGAYISLNVNLKAHLIKNYTVKPIGGILSGYSTTLFILHCFGAKISNECCYPNTRHRFENKLLFAVLVHLAMSICLLAVPVVCLVHNYKIKEAISHGLLSSMRHYAGDKRKKQDLDDIQIEYRCCGSFNHTDWFRVKWMRGNLVPPVNSKKFSRRQYLHSVPFSCCDPSFAGPCFHSEVMMERGAYRYPNHGFFKRGCAEVLRDELEEVLWTASVTTLLPFVLELSIAVLARYLQTSLDDSKRRKDPTGVGIGMLFGTHFYESHLPFKMKTQEEMKYNSPGSKVQRIVDKSQKEEEMKVVQDAELGSSIESDYTLVSFDEFGANHGKNCNKIQTRKCGFKNVKGLKRISSRREKNGRKESLKGESKSKQFSDFTKIDLKQKKNMPEDKFELLRHTYKVKRDVKADNALVNIAKEEVRNVQIKNTSEMEADKNLSQNSLRLSNKTRTVLKVVDKKSSGKDDVAKPLLKPNQENAHIENVKLATRKENKQERLKLKKKYNLKSNLF